MSGKQILTQFSFEMYVEASLLFCETLIPQKSINVTAFDFQIIIHTA